MPTQWGTVKDEYMVMVTPMMRVGLSSGTYYVSIESDTEFSLNYMAYGTGQGGAFFFEVKEWDLLVMDKAIIIYTVLVISLITIN